jgi:hypothetical protein
MKFHSTSQRDEQNKTANLFLFIREYRAAHNQRELASPRPGGNTLSPRVALEIGRARPKDGFPRYPNE